MTMAKCVDVSTNYSFTSHFNEGNGSKLLLGGKGAGLNIMMKVIGLPVPPGFTITTDACMAYWQNGNGELPKQIEHEVCQRMLDLEQETAKQYGGHKNPLLVSVRSGAAVSMPGMMDTILNLGLNDRTVEALARESGDLRFALDCYRRFIQMFSEVAMGIEKEKFYDALARAKKKCGAKDDHQLRAEDLAHLVQVFKDIYYYELRQDFPQDVWQQLILAVGSVFRSWNNDRAIAYRRIHKIPNDMGTAVNIQSMVFGNMGEDSGTGVAFTRNPSTGEPGVTGEYLINAQGEDVVAGIRTPLQISQLRDTQPEIYQQFVEVCSKLEEYYADMQDIEFTVEKGELFLLQTRTAKRTARAAFRIAVDMVNEGLISQTEAIMRIDPQQVNQMLHPVFDDNALKEAVQITKGLNASPGAAVGKIVFTSKDAVELASKGEKVILVRVETSADDIEGMHAAQGILTAHGGLTSHAAVVARSMGRTCVAGCEEIVVDDKAKRFQVGDKYYQELEVISIDGSTGAIYKGIVPKREPKLTNHFQILMSWADERRKLQIRTNADTPLDVTKAIELGAEGVGLVRTEHMFFAPERITVFRKMILAENSEDRLIALNQLKTFQKKDFIAIFRILGARPITIRLLDPPLHEFLPISDSEIKRLAKKAKASPEKFLAKAKTLAEKNPMLGHRGCRLGITDPEIYEMQASAIFEALFEVAKKKVYPLVELEIPLVIDPAELTILKDKIKSVYDKAHSQNGKDIEWQFGAMLEVPRACAVADQLAPEVDFFSFGTNDLTQTMLGISRDDAESKFLAKYIDLKIFPQNPFAQLDQTSVGFMMKIALQKVEGCRRKLTIGICGEHGGDPESIQFCHDIGLDYVSCSPYRVPVARLAAAQAAIRQGTLTSN